MKNCIIGLIIILSLSACRSNSSTETNHTTDSLSYRFDSLSQTSPLKAKNYLEQEDSTYVKIKYPVFENNTINQTIINTILAGTSPDEKPKDLTQFASNFISSYEDFRKDFPERPQTWYTTIVGQVYRQTPNYLSIGINTEQYAGGAHGSHFINYLNFNPKTGAPLILDDFLLPNSYAELMKIAEEKFRKDEKLGEQDNYDNYFFEEGKFALAANYKLSDQGLEFLYNNYEIKPYSDGTTTLILPYALINHLLKSTYKK